jgi:hypothetical protein
MRVMFFVSLLLGTLLAKEYAIVVSQNTSLNTISLKTVQKLYLKKKRSIGDKRYMVLNFPANSEERTAFMKNVMQLDLETWENYYNEMHFKGIDPPKVMRSSTSIKRFIVNVPNVLAYIPKSDVDDSVLVLKIFSAN